MVRKMIRRAGPLNDEGFEKLCKVVERIASGKEPGLARAFGGKREGLTVEQLADQWTSGALAKLYPDHVKAEEEPNATRTCSAGWVRSDYPDGETFGERPVATITLDDCDHVMTGLPEDRRVLFFPAAVRPGGPAPAPAGCLPVTAPFFSPATAWLAASRGKHAGEGLALPVRGLRPDELQGSAPRPAPLLRRARARRPSSERSAEVGMGRCRSERGVMRLDENKSEDPRIVGHGRGCDARFGALAPDARQEGREGPARSSQQTSSAIDGPLPRFFATTSIPPAWSARAVQGDAGPKRFCAPTTSGVVRDPGPGRGIRTEAWVTDRTGHRSSEMIYRYKRAARTAAELDLGWFSPLDEAIPESCRSHVSRCI